MKRTRTIVRGVVLFIFCGAQMALSQAATDSAQIVRDPEAVALLQQSFGQMLQKVGQLPELVHLEGKTYIPADPSGSTGSFSATITEKRQFLRTVMFGHTSHFATLGSKAKSKKDSDATRQMGSGIKSPTSELFPLLEHYTEFLDKTISVQKLSDTKINGTLCAQILVKLPPGFRLPFNATFDVKVFIEKNTGLLKGLEYPSPNTSYFNPNFLVRSTFDSYQILAGMLTPTVITKHINGQPILAYKIQKIDMGRATDTIPEDF